MSYSETVLAAAHNHSSDHRSEIEASCLCRCFYCLDLFPPQKVERWLNEGSGTALCPSCQIDAVIGDRSGYPVCLSEFAQAMHERWFEASNSLSTMADPDRLGVREEMEADYSWTEEDIAAIRRAVAQADRGELTPQNEVEREINDLLR